MKILRMEFCELTKVRGNDFAYNIVFYETSLVSLHRNFIEMLTLMLAISEFCQLIS